MRADSNLMTLNQRIPIAGLVLAAGLLAVSPGEVDVIREDAKVSEQPTSKDKLASHYKAGEQASARGDLEVALTHYRSCLDIDRDFEPAWLGVGLVYESAGQYQDAAQAYREAARAEPHAVRAWSRLGMVYLKTSEMTLAERMFTKALKIDPTNSEAYTGLAILQNYRDKPESALELLTKATELDESNVVAWTQKAAIELKQNSTSTAIQTITDGLGVNPNHPSLLTFQARLLMESKDLAGAEKAVRAALKVASHSAGIHEQLGDILSKDPSRTVEALKSYENALQLSQRRNDTKSVQRLRSRIGEIQGSLPEQPSHQNELLRPEF